MTTKCTVTLTKEEREFLLFVVGYAAGCMVRDKCVSKDTADRALALYDTFRVLDSPDEERIE